MKSEYILKHLLQMYRCYPGQYKLQYCFRIGVSFEENMGNEILEKRKWPPFLRNGLILTFLLISLLTDSVSAQYKTGFFGCSWKKDSIVPAPRFPIKHFVVPAAMITYGFIALKNDVLQDLDEATQEEIWSDHPHNHTSIDNYLQYAPAVIVYGLNLAGICGELICNAMALPFYQSGTVGLAISYHLP